MNDEQLQSLLDTWFEDTDPAPPNAQRTAAELMAQVPRTPQRGRWLPFPLFRRKAQPPTATDTTDYQPRPIPASNGHAPTVIGRTRTMFSPVKAIVAGALVFAIGGAYLIGQPAAQQPAGGVPGAQSDVAGDGGFTITVIEELADMAVFPGTTERGEGLYVHEGMGLITLVEASDPRLSGTWSEVWNARARTGLRDQDHFVSVGTLLVENEGGTWLGRIEGFEVAGDPFFISLERAVLEGQDGYEGLTAIVHWDEGNLPMDDVDAMGVIFDYGLPPQPDTADLPTIEPPTD